VWFYVFFDVLFAQLLVCDWFDGIVEVGYGDVGCYYFFEGVCCVCDVVCVGGVGFLWR